MTGTAKDGIARDGIARDGIVKDIASNGGSFAWTEESDGALTEPERRALKPVLRRALVDHVRADVRRRLGRSRPSSLGLSELWTEPPDSLLCREASSAAGEIQAEVVDNHARRAFAYGAALARMDGVELDAEVHYVACLFHDAGLAIGSANHATSGRCFTHGGAVAGAKTGKRFGASPAQIESLRDAICRHITPGIETSLDPLAAYIQAGSMVDLNGHRLGEIPGEIVERAVAVFPRLDARRRFAQMWRAEAGVVPDGRAAAIESQIRFSYTVRFAPRKLEG